MTSAVSLRPVRDCHKGFDVVFRIILWFLWSSGSRVSVGGWEQSIGGRMGAEYWWEDESRVSVGGWEQSIGGRMGAEYWWEDRASEHQWEDGNRVLVGGWEQSFCGV